MSIEEIIINKVRILPPDKQQEALDFVEFLLAKIQKQELSSQEKNLGVFRSLYLRCDGSSHGQTTSVMIYTSQTSSNSGLYSCTQRNTVV